MVSDVPRRLHIAFIWGSADGEERVERLAQHRNRIDHHARIYASRLVEELPAPSWTFECVEGTSPEEFRRLEREHVRRNRRICAELRAKGLLPAAGRNLPAHEIREHLICGGAGSRDGG